MFVLHLELSRFKGIVSVLAKEGRLAESECDMVILEFSNFSRDQAVELACKNFSSSDDRLDEFYSNLFSQNDHSQKYRNLWLKVIKPLILLSHGQAGVERGFSVNKNVSVNNMASRTIVAKRHIKDFVKHCGGLENVQITKDMLKHCRHARQRYVNFLEEQKQEREICALERQYETAQNEIHEMEKSLKIMQDRLSFLREQADQAQFEAEGLGTVKAMQEKIAVSNSHRKRARELEGEVEELNKAISSKKQKLKQT